MRQQNETFALAQRNASLAKHDTVVQAAAEETTTQHAPGALVVELGVNTTEREREAVCVVLVRGAATPGRGCAAIGRYACSWLSILHKVVDRACEWCNWPKMHKSQNDVPLSAQESVILKMCVIRAHSRSTPQPDPPCIRLGVGICAAPPRRHFWVQITFAIAAVCVRPHLAQRKHPNQYIGGCGPHTSHQQPSLGQ